MYSSLRRILLTVSITVLIFVSLLWLLVTQPMLPQRQETSPPAIDPSRLEAHVKMLSETFFPRSEENPDNLDRAAFHIREEFEKAGGRVATQPFDVGGVTYRNVMAHFGPEAGERIIVGAHYDACEEYPGADDNASGIAGLIELARLLGNSPLKTHVELVAYALEEPPNFGTSNMGSAVHAESMRRQNISVRIMIALEMIGFFSDADGSQDFPVSLLRLFYPSRGDFIAIVGSLDQIGTVRRAKTGMRKASPMPVRSINAPALVPGMSFSDHRNYWIAGYDAVMITDTAFFRNPNYHLATDTADTLDYGKMAMVVQGVYGLLREFDQ